MDDFNKYLFEMVYEEGTLALPNKDNISEWWNTMKDIDNFKKVISYINHRLFEVWCEYEAGSNEFLVYDSTLDNKHLVHYQNGYGKIHHSYHIGNFDSLITKIEYL